ISQRPITMAEAAERTHPGITQCLSHLLLRRNESMPPNYLSNTAGLFGNFWVMSRANFQDYMEWSLPLVRWCLQHPEDPFIQSHRRALGYVMERLFILWYSIRQKKLQGLGALQTVRCGNSFLDPELNPAGAQKEQFILLSEWHAHLYELCQRHRA